MPKPLLRAIKNVSAARFTAEMAPSAMRFQKAARLEMVAKMTGRPPKMRTNRLKKAHDQFFGNRRFPVTLSQTIL